MISLVSGKIISKSNFEIVVLTTGGVGYRVFIKPTAINEFKINDQVSISTYLAVGENMLDLYGFSNESEKQLFIYFISVSGIGPKSALHLLSLGTVEEIGNAISAGDVEYLTKVSGVGRKTAERIVVELRDKIAKGARSEDWVISGNLGDVVDGLVAMGYSAQQAREAIKKLDAGDKSSEDLLREALRKVE
ncbi:MAG: Holliday junction branch migration protein RuvA [bacterium]